MQYRNNVTSCRWSLNSLATEGSWVSREVRTPVQQLLPSKYGLKYLTAVYRTTRSYTSNAISFTRRRLGADVCPVQVLPMRRPESADFRTKKNRIQMSEWGMKQRGVTQTTNLMMDSKPSCTVVEWVLNIGILKLMIEDLRFLSQVCGTVSLAFKMYLFNLFIKLKSINIRLLEYHYRAPSIIFSKSYYSNSLLKIYYA